LSVLSRPSASRSALAQTGAKFHSCIGRRLWATRRSAGVVAPAQAPCGDRANHSTQ
jgi:hypothetical protein